MSDRYHQTVEASAVTTNDEAVKTVVEKIIADHLKENMNVDVYKKLFNCIDLTTLSTTSIPNSRTWPRYASTPTSRRWSAPFST